MLKRSHRVYDIAMRSEAVDDIRKEIATVLKTTDGVMTTPALFNMKLLDSCMRESQRFTPAFTGTLKCKTCSQGTPPS